MSRLDGRQDRLTRNLQWVVGETQQGFPANFAELREGAQLVQSMLFERRGGLG